MPSETKPPASAVDIFEDLRDLLPDLEDHGASHDELDLLNDVLGDSEYQALGDIFDILSMDLPRAKDDQATQYYQNVTESLNSISRPTKDELELKALLEKPHVKALIETHDDVAGKMYDDVFANSIVLAAPPPPVFEEVGETHRHVTLRKNGKEPLGITVRLDEDNNLIIARILQDSLAAKQSLLRVGDIVRAVNGVEVFVPEDLMIVLKESEESICIKIVPSSTDSLQSDIIYVKACFQYEPMADRLIPCKKAGLPFRQGDVLAIVDNNDENWWQARLADRPNAPVGLIPSRALQEKRQAYVQPDLTKTKTSLLCGLKTKKKKKIGYNSSDTADYDACDIRVYEEVERPKSHRRTIILVGASGVGKRSLKERLMKEFPDRYTAAIPDTSRPRKPKEQDGQGYNFVDPNKMELDIKNNLYIDHGEFGGHLYGTRLTSIRNVIQGGKTCILDVSVRSLKFLMSPEFRPYVLFIAAPSVEAMKVMKKEGRRLNNNNPRGIDPTDLFMEERFVKIVKESKEVERQCKGIYDELIVNDDFENTYKTIVRMLQEMERSQKWVPKEWNDEN